MTTAVPASPSVDSIRETVISWRRYLHQHPELSFQEERTAQWIYDALAEIGGLEVSRPTKTSVLARLITSKPGPVLAMRADIDALPIDEKNKHDFVSKTPGVMHACGHDGHTSMLLGAVAVLAGMREQLRGELRFIFQHAEELLPGGAQELVKAGVVRGVDMVIGAHLWLPLPFGDVAVKPGALMAAADTFRITITGKAGHAAMPQQAIDTVLVAAEAVVNLHHIVARNVDPLEPAVMTISQIHGGTAHNIIPATVELEGTIRTFDLALRDQIPALMHRVLGGITSAHGASYELTVIKGYASVKNDERATDLLRRAVVRGIGEEHLIEATPNMGGEDFSAYQEGAPGAFFFIGARNDERGIVHPHHHECFDLDERALDYGTRVFVAAALEHLGGGAGA
jgi:amidohydrolase